MLFQDFKIHLDIYKTDICFLHVLKKTFQHFSTGASAGQQPQPQCTYTGDTQRAQTLRVVPAGASLGWTPTELELLGLTSEAPPQRRPPMVCTPTGVRAGTDHRPRATSLNGLSWSSPAISRDRSGHPSILTIMGSFLLWGTVEVVQRIAPIHTTATFLPTNLKTSKSR